MTSYETRDELSEKQFIVREQALFAHKPELPEAWDPMADIEAAIAIGPAVQTPLS